MGESSSSHLCIFTCFMWVPKSCNYTTVGMVNVGPALVSVTLTNDGGKTL